jgi:hypothetical protein
MFQDPRNIFKAISHCVVSILTVLLAGIEEKKEKVYNSFGTFIRPSLSLIQKSLMLIIFGDGKNENFCNQVYIFS